MTEGENTPPIEEGQVVDDLMIIGLGRKGDGIGKVNNFVVIVPQTEVNQTYKVKITKVMSTVAFGEIHND